MITQPPAPWLNKEDIRKLQKERNVLRYLVHKKNLVSIWNKFLEVRNKIKTKIKSIKILFQEGPIVQQAQRTAEHHTPYFISQSPANLGRPSAKHHNAYWDQRKIY